MERYSAYKDSGIDWIGKIPVGWRKCRLKTLLRRITVKGFPDETVLSLYRDYGVVPKDSRDDNFNRTSENTENYQLVEPKNVVVNKMKAWQGSLAVSQYRGIVSPAYFIYQIVDDAIYPQYLHYALRNKDYCEEYRRMSGGIRPNQWDLDPIAFLNLPTVIPSFAEQQAIADYLDEATGTIDAAVKDIERSIELLNEYRQSVISEAVTKGLDPTAPMKDSGIDWIGQIPAHWELLPLKRRANFLPGYAFKSEDFNQTGGIRLLRGVNVSVGAIRWEDNVYVNSYAVNGLEEYRLSRGDILVGLDRPWIQAGMRVAQVDDESDGSYLVQRVAKVIPDEHQLSSTFLIYLFHTNIFAEAMDSTTTGVSVPHISTGQLGEVAIPCPPISEQQAISDALKKRTESINSLIQQKQSLLVRLREYRASLISECVTGKVKVPGVTEE